MSGTEFKIWGVQIGDQISPGHWALASLPPEMLFEVVLHSGRHHSGIRDGPGWPIQLPAVPTAPLALGKSGLLKQVTLPLPVATLGP